ncbi:MAG: UDP-N-acetylmuramoyl-L-alanine--D-glutamate ligase [Myxococcales bacterium]
MRLAGRKALVVGLGKSGVAAVRLLADRGARVAVADDKKAGDLAPTLEGLPVSELFAGGLSEAAFRDRDLVVASPGVPPSLPLLAQARARGIEVIGEVELASRFIEEPIAGITGTNGKSTTTALTAHLLTRSGFSVFAGGNLGDALSNRVLRGGRLDATVCELSSYQLEGIVSLRCAAATVLNVTPDHIERHPSLESYAKAKERIFLNQREGDAAALNVADSRVAAMRTNPGVARREFDPRFPRASGAPAYRTGPRTLSVHGESYELRAATLRGAHNAENALAALLLATHFGARREALQEGLDSYPGLPHRLEPVRTLDGVEWINDSKATNVDSVEKSLSAFERGVVLIMGGKGKGAPYAPLRSLFKGRVEALLTIGEDAERIEQELGDLVPTTSCKDLLRACTEARRIARSGSVVLLSPACASYDQFKNFEDRGERFKEIVRRIE